jgi:GT2 family glycosyltransferase
MDEPTTVMTDGCVFNHPDREGFFQREPVALTPLQQVTEVEIVNGCCMMISAELIRTIGLIDERFFLVHEESDFCLRAREAGFRCGVIGEALVWHKGSSSFQRTGKRVQRYYDARNLYLLLDKHVDEQPAGRSRIASMTAYLRYVYHRWSIEHENGNADAANAVVEGLYDALSARFGPLQSNGRWGLGLVRGLFQKMHQLRSR